MALTSWSSAGSHPKAIRSAGCVLRGRWKRYTVWADLPLESRRRKRPLVHLGARSGKGQKRPEEHSF